MNINLFHWAGKNSKSSQNPPQLPPSEDTSSEDKPIATAKNILVWLTVFFFVASLAQLFYLHTRVSDTPNLNVKEVLNESNKKLTDEQYSISLVELQSRVTLEGYVLKRRYHQANILLMSRIWVSYLSFVTGMILCLVGASFILGRIKEPVSKLDANSQVVKFSIASSSPGIILASLGSILIMTSILTNHRITIEDVSIYLRRDQNQSMFDLGLPSDVEEPDNNGSTPREPSNSSEEQLDDLLEP